MRTSIRKATMRGAFRVAVNVEQLRPQRERARCVNEALSGSGDVTAGARQQGGHVIWDFLQRYDESWIWRREDRHDVTESSRNFAALDECIDDAASHGYTPPQSKHPRPAGRTGHKPRSK